MVEFRSHVRTCSLVELTDPSFCAVGAYDCRGNELDGSLGGSGEETPFRETNAVVTWALSRRGKWRRVMSLAAVAAFKGMTGQDLAQMELASITLEPRDGATIFAQGDPADAVFAVVAGDGHVRIGAIDRHSGALMV